MKKIVCLLIALCLTAALFSCTDTPETKQEEKTPSVTETQIEPTTPSEITTPNETATPNEVTSPNEQDITTPEIVTPTEPDEPTEEPDENVVILPEADENTKYITIEFPEDFPETFPEKPYVEPVLVSPEEFEWGEYLPVVTYGTNTVAHDEWVIETAILSSESDNLTMAHDIYTNEYGRLNEYLYDQNYKSDFLRGESQEITDEIGLFFSVANEYQGVYINGIKHDIIIDEEIPETVQIFFADSCNKELWLINVSYQYKFATYLYNSETNQSEFLGNHFFEASLSPDGKYIAYTSPIGQLGDMLSAKDYSSEEHGFYMKNLENGKTVFYTCSNECNPYHGYHCISAWAKNQGKSLIF